MKMLDNIRHFILEDELQINVTKNKVNIVNYERIGQFDNNKVIIHHSEGSIVITGEKLIISKLLKDEVLVIGVIKMIELR